MKAVGYAGMTTKVEAFNQALATLGKPMPVGSPLQKYFDVVAEFVADHAASPEAASSKWMQRDFHQWYLSMLAVDSLCDSVVKLSQQPSAEFLRILDLVLSNDISQDYKPSQSKDFLYELQVASWFKDAGFAIDIAEPDLRISGNGLSTELGIACKYPSSEKKLNDRISEGYEQITRQGLSGFVAVGMDLLVMKEMERFIQFPESEEAILGGVSGELEQWVNKTIKRRAGVPGRAPLDGALFSLRMGGVATNPARLQWVTQFTFQCTDGNPIRSDIGTILEAFGQIGVNP